MSPLRNIESVGYRQQGCYYIEDNNGVLARECMGIGLQMDSVNDRTLGVCTW